MLDPENSGSSQLAIAPLDSFFFFPFFPDRLYVSSSVPAEPPTPHRAWVCLYAVPPTTNHEM